DAENATILRVQDNMFERAAVYGSMRHSPAPPPIDRETPQGRAVVEARTIHIHDAAAQMETDFPGLKTRQPVTGLRTFLVTPLLHQGVAIGAIQIRRSEDRPFSQKQINLLETFADQAVIAIENVRLFQELKQTLEQQTSTGEVLRVIASSPTDLKPVLDAITESAARLCAANDAVLFRLEGDRLLRSTHYGPMPTFRAFGEELSISHDTVHGRAILECKTIHVEDIAAEIETEFPDSRALQQHNRARTLLATPLLREGAPIGALVIRRTEVRPFTEKQIKLLETFASQAVIAIENTRLFQELKESLEQQTATSEILGVIASSPTDIQPVLNAVAKNAARLCESQDALIYRVEGEMMRKVARYGDVPDLIPVGETRPISRGSKTGRAIVDRQTIHTHDTLSEREEDVPDTWAIGREESIRTTLAVPLLREGVSIGAIH